MNILLATNFSKKLLSSHLKPLERVILKLKNVSIPLCFPMSLPRYVFKLLCFLSLPELYSWHEHEPAAGWSPCAGASSWQSYQNMESCKFSVYFILFRQVKGPEQRYLRTGHIGTCS